MQTTGLIPAFFTVSMWCMRFLHPSSTQATFSSAYSLGMGLPGTGMGAPPWHLRARIVATTTAQWGLSPGITALEVPELFKTNVCAKAGLRNIVVSKLKSHAISNHGTLANSDIGKRTGMDYHRWPSRL